MGPQVRVELRCDGLTASATLPPYTSYALELVAFLRDIERDWRGWPGAKAFGAPDSDLLAISATHDGLASVTLDVHLKATWPPSPRWSAQGQLRLDVGSVEGIVSALDRWVAKVWPKASGDEARPTA